MKKWILTTFAFICLTSLTQIAFAFTLKLVSINGDRADVLVNGMQRSFPVGFVSQEGIKLVSASPGKATFQSGKNTFPLTPGQVFNDDACQSQQKTGSIGIIAPYGFGSLPCGVTSSSSDADANQRRMDANTAYEVNRKRQNEEYAAAVLADKNRRQLDADLQRRPEQRIYNIPLKK